MASKTKSDLTIAVVGLGYVGLPLAAKFGAASVKVIGFDIDEKKVAAIKRGDDPSREVSKAELERAKIDATTDPTTLRRANFIIIAVPTPVTEAKEPDLSFVENAATIVGRNLSPGTTVVLESTVAPGTTEEVLIPIIEKESGLKHGKRFFVGYSPERANPGDYEHTVDRIVKIVAGEDAKTLMHISKVYSIVCKGGIHQAPNIKTAEAAKVVENIQRDLNIALVNELALIFQRIGVNTNDVLEAASTKWNFHRYTTGLVGGHCIGVDSYYLTSLAQRVGYHPEVILAGRRINDYMASHVAEMMVKGLIEAGKPVRGANVLIMGLTFKENVNDTRNSKVKDVIGKLKEYRMNVYAHDPLLTEEQVNHGIGIKNSSLSDLPVLDGVIFAVPHGAFSHMTLRKIGKMMHNPGVFVDVKSAFATAKVPKGILYKSL